MRRSILMCVGVWFLGLTLSISLAVVPAISQTIAGHTGNKSAGTGASEALLRGVLDWFERAHREYQETVVRGLSVPTGKETFASRRLPDATATAPAVSAEQSEIDARIRRQVEARALEGQRAAEADRLATASARATAMMAAAVRDRQKAADEAKLAEAARTTAAVLAEVERARAAPPAAGIAVADGQTATKPVPADKPPGPATSVDPPAATAGSPATPAATAPAAPPAENARPVTDPGRPVRWNRLPRSASRDQGGKRYQVSVRSGEGANTVVLPASRTATRSAAEGLAAAASAAGDRLLGKAHRTVAILTGIPGPASHKQSCRRAGRKVDPPAVYTVKHGDNLWVISRRHYDRGRKYEKIVHANAAKIAEPDRIFPCQRFYLPI